MGGSVFADLRIPGRGCGGGAFADSISAGLDIGFMIRFHGPMQTIMIQMCINASNADCGGGCGLGSSQVCLSQL